jgi:hypothetical protein
MGAGVWEESVLIMEPGCEVVVRDTLILFEVLDSADKKGSSSVDGKCTGWAFLRPIAANGASNMGQLLRLQLFKPSSYKNKESNLPQVLI